MKRYWLVLALLPFSLLAQTGKDTVITIEGNKVVGTKQVDRPPAEDAANSFAEADTNGDGRISPTEARDSGILNFKKFDRGNKGYLTEKEYDAAINAE